MATDSQRGARLVYIDVVRGLAVFGILLVNIWAFAWGLTSLRYGTLPAHAPILDRAAIFLVGAFAELKFYPIFAFLFGAGLALQTRALRRALGGWAAAMTRYRRRLFWLLGCGVLHGVLIWSGDVLSFYAVGGVILLPLAAARLRYVKPCCYVIGGVYGLTMAVMLLTVAWDRLPDDIASAVLQFHQVRAAYASPSLSVVAHQRLSDFIESRMVGLVFFLPHTLLIVMLGMLSVRLGWLTRPARHARSWRRVRLIGLGLGLPLNLLWGYMVMAEARNPYTVPFNTPLWQELLYVTGPLLASGYLASILLARAAVMAWLAQWLAPVGRMALTNYLTHSVLGTLLLQGPGLGYGTRMGPAALVATCLALMALQVWVCRWWLRHHAQGPVEAWWRRHTQRSHKS